MAQDEIPAIRALVDEVLASWNSHDMIRWGAAFAQDADFVNVIGHHQKGREEIIAAHVHLHATIFKTSQLALRELTVRLVAPMVAVAHIHWTMTGAETMPGWKVGQERRGILSWTLVKQVDGWRVTASHNTDTVDLPMPKAS